MILTQPEDEVTTQMSEATRSAVLQLHDLSVSVATPAGVIRLVDRLNLSVRPGERLALVGESGSGKSVTARAILRLDSGVILSGQVLLKQRDLLTLSEREMRKVRGAQVAMVFQDPMTGLNPLMTIGDQVAETLRVRGVSRKDARQRAVDALDRLGIANAAARIRAYPHEFSGGMRQRVCLAMAIIADPDVLIADEPTTALDVRVQEQVLSLIDTLSRESGLAVLLITHDLGIVAGFADRVAVLYSGRKVEDGGVDVTYDRPLHPYTAGLLASVPRIDQAPQARLLSIAGAPSNPISRPSGCPFHPRCSARLPVCATDEPAAMFLDPDRVVCCHLHQAVSECETA